MIVLSGYTPTLIDTLWPMVVVVIISTVFYLFKKQITSSKAKRILPYMFFVLMFIFGYKLVFAVLLLPFDFSNAIENVPLHLCDISAILILLYTASRKNIFLQVLFYQGIIGAFVTFVFPSITEGPTTYAYYEFFFAHILLFIVPLYYYIIEDFRPTKKTLQISLIAVHIAAFIAVITNFLFKTHFMYLNTNNSENLFAFIPIHEVLPAINNFVGLILFGEILTFIFYFATHYIFVQVNKRNAM